MVTVRRLTLTNLSIMGHISTRPGTFHRYGPAESKYDSPFVFLEDLDCARKNIKTYNHKKN